MPPTTETLEINFVTGLTAGAPDISQFYLMSTSEAAPNFNTEMNYQGDIPVHGFAHHPNHRRTAPQVPPLNLMGAYDSAADGNLQYVISTEDNPRSDGGKFVRSDRRNKGPSNYPPQIGS